MISVIEEYREVLAYLTQRDMRHEPHKKHRLPLERYAMSDCEFFFTLCARGQHEPFRDPRLARAIIEALLWRKTHHRWLLFCYCLMPDHLHFLVQLPYEDIRYIDAGARGVVPFGILDQVGQFKRYTTSQIWWKHGGERALWQKSSYDRVIRYNDSVEQAVSYILNNPVRKGLVTSWEDYPYSAIVDEW